MRISRILCLVLVFPCLLALRPQQSEHLSPPSSRIPESLFGMHIHSMVIPRPSMKSPDPWPTVRFGTWRLWDAYVEWPRLEPQPGKWNFDTLDRYVALAQQQNVDLLLPLAMTPTWASSRPAEKSAYTPGGAAPPKNLDDWRTYVRTVSSRYKGRIHYYEIWNEPNLKDFFSSSPQDLVDLTREARKVLKEEDPSIEIVSPAATGDSGVVWLDQFLKNGGGHYVDIIGYHFYVVPRSPEQMLPLIAKVESIMNKYRLGDRQLWDTETGWRIANDKTEVKQEGTGFSSRVLSDEQASAYVARAYVLAWASGISRLYWYAWDDGVMGLTEADGATTKPPAIAYGEVQKWLVGARLTSCSSDERGTWTCATERAGNSKAWIVWNPDLQFQYSIPKQWDVRDIRKLDGTSREIAPGSTIQIGPTPQLLENGAR